MFKYLFILTLFFVGKFSLEGVVELTDQNFAELVQADQIFGLYYLQQIG